MLREFYNSHELSYSLQIRSTKFTIQSQQYFSIPRNSSDQDIEQEIILLLERLIKMDIISWNLQMMGSTERWVTNLPLVSLFP